MSDQANASQPAPEEPEFRIDPKEPREYTAEDLKHLSDLEHVRERPSMYIGDTAVRGLHHLVYEVVDNSIDEAMAGYAKNVSIKINVDGSVTVEDDGPGVTPEQLTHLFEPFWRGDRADLRNDGGTGLGLTIAREVVLRLGGEIQAQTRPEVEGLRFTIRLAA